MGTFIDIHTLQTLPPSNPNRDGQGNPKTATYGGARRMRVSSQAWKRAIRNQFRATIDTSRLATRSRDFATIIADRTTIAADDIIPISTLIMKNLGIPADKNRPGSSSAMQFLGEGAWDLIAATAQHAAESDDPADTIRAARTDLRHAIDADTSIDTALFGRMSASDDKGTGSQYTIDAACQVAHAIGVTRNEPETDWFAAIDDAAHDNGAGMIGETDFMSSTLYRYACINVDLLATNLAGDLDATRLAIETFLHAWATSLPQGKRNSYGHQTLPALVRTIIRTDRPVNLVEAYEHPITGDTIPNATLALYQQEDDYQDTYRLAPTTTHTTATRHAKAGIPDNHQDDLTDLDTLITQTTNDAL